MFEPGRDQAAGLRQLFAQHTLRVVPLMSGEGTGDSVNCAINLAAALARQGRRTVLIDGDRHIVRSDCLAINGLNHHVVVARPLNSADEAVRAATVLMTVAVPVASAFVALFQTMTTAAAEHVIGLHRSVAGRAMRCGSLR